MTSAQTRISQDVWEKAAVVADKMGLANERQAVEAVFRVFADAYMSGATIAQTVTNTTPTVHTIVPHPSDDDQIDAAADLDALIAV